MRIASRTPVRLGHGDRPLEMGLVRDVAGRFVRADGMSHVRALAYESALVVVSGFVGVVGLSSVLDLETLRGVVGELAGTISPGPAGRLLGEAAQQGAQGGGVAAAFGLAAALASGTLAMAQVERSANRLSGSDEDRPVVRRYLVGVVLAVTVGLLFTLGGLAIGAGRALPTGFGWTDEVASVWSVLRWPVGVAISATAVAVLFRFAPRGRLGPGRALAWGTAVAVVLWVVFTALLSAYLSIQGASPYGPLLTFVALLLWSVLSSLALHVGLATACALSHRGATADRASA